MPASAEKALKGMLAEGVSAEDILSALSQSGYEVEPPEGDESYDKPKGAVIAIGMGKPPEEPEKEEVPSSSKSRQKIAKMAMEKNGY